MTAYPEISLHQRFLLLFVFFGTGHQNVSANGRTLNSGENTYIYRRTATEQLVSSRRRTLEITWCREDRTHIPKGPSLARLIYSPMINR